MRLSELSKFLDRTLPYAELRKTILEELSNYKRQLSKKGSSAEINIIGDKDIIVTEKHLNVLCQAYLKGEMENHEMYYIADALQLSEEVDFFSREIGEKVALLTDPEINYGELTPKLVRKILEE